MLIFPFRWSDLSPTKSSELVGDTIDLKQTAFYKKLDTIFRLENNSDRDLKFLKNLSQDAFNLFVWEYASRAIKGHVTSYMWGYIDHAFPWINQNIVWSAIDAWILNDDIDLDYIRYDHDDTKESMIRQSANSLSDLKDIVYQSKLKDRERFQSRIDDIQDRCCDICDD